jgi:DNA polymerase-3 subunit gamma/tau
MPDPGALLEKLANGESLPARTASAVEPAPSASAATSREQQSTFPKDFRALVDLVGAGGKQQLAQQLHDYCGVIRFAPPELALKLTKALPAEFVRELAAALSGQTGATWQVTIADGEAEPSLREQERMAGDRERQEVLNSPLVTAAFEAFPGAELAGYTLDDQRSA